MSALRPVFPLPNSIALTKWYDAEVDEAVTTFTVMVAIVCEEMGRCGRFYRMKSGQWLGWFRIPVHYLPITNPIREQFESRLQDRNICVWAEVETTELNMERRDFHIYETGQLMIEAAQRRKYIGTFFLNEAARVYHVFEIFHENATYPGYSAT